MNRLLTSCIIIVLITTYTVFAQTPVNPDYLKAQELEHKGNYKEAQELFEKLYASSGIDQYFWRLILVSKRLDDFDRMEVLARSRLKSRPNELMSLRYLAESLYGQGKTDDAYRIINKMIGEHWSDKARIHLAAELLTSHNDYDKAIQMYTSARAKNNDDTLYSNDLARIYLVRFEFNKAIEEYLKTLKQVEITYVNIESVVKNALVENVEPASLERPLREFLEKNPTSIKAARLISSLRYRTGDYFGAYDALIQTALNTFSPADIWNLAERLNRDNHTDEALMVYDNYCRLFVKETNRPAALLKAAALKIDKGDDISARSDYLTLANDYPGTAGAAEATLRILVLSEKEMDFERYSESLDDFASSTKFRNVAFEAFMALARSYMKNGYIEKAQKSLIDARVKARGKPEIFAIASQAAYFQFFAGDFETMSNEIDACLKYAPNDVDINDLLALKVLKMRCSTGADVSALTTYAHGRYSLSRGNIDDAVDSLTIAAQDTATVVSSAASAALARLYSDRKDYTKAYSWYRMAVSAAKDTTERVKAMIDAADLLVAELNDKDNARSLYFETITSYPGTVYDSVARRKLRAMTESKD